MKEKDREKNAHEMAYRAQRSAETSRERMFHRKMFDGFKVVWRKAPIEETGLKPLRDIWDFQQIGPTNVTEEDFWKALERSVHEGFFDGTRELYSVTDRLNRITSQTLRETYRWDNKASPLLLALIRATWATIGTMSEWAHSRGFEVPPHWQDAIENALQTNPDDRRSRSKSETTKSSILQAFDKNPKENAEQVGAYVERISKHLAAKKVQAGERLVRKYLEQRKRVGTNGKK